MEENMNWLLIVLLIVTILSAIAGYYRGFVRTALSMVFLILVLTVSGWISPYVGSALEEHTQITENIHNACRDMVADALEKQTDGITSGNIAEQQEILNAVGLPGELLGSVFSSEPVQTGQENAVEELADRTADVLTDLAVDAVVFVISFAAAWIVVSLIRRAADLFAELPVIGFVNRIFGGLLGIVRALIWIWLFFLVLTIFAGTEWGSFCMKAVQEDSILLFLYHNNLVLKFLLTIL